MSSQSCQERILVGSVATRLLHASHCSVLIAPPSATGIAREAGIARELAWQAERAVLPGVL